MSLIRLMAPHSYAGVSCAEWGGTFDSTPNRMDESFIMQRGSEGRAAVSPSQGTTDTSGAPLELQVTGLQPGVDRFRVSATPLGRKAALVANIPVTITEDARGSRRIRHTAAVLTDPGRPSA
jgi:hypothetical protein